MLHETREMLVREMRLEAVGVVSVLLEDPLGSALDPWAAGAHVEIALPSGTRRQYSLCGDPSDRHRYRIAVLRQPGGRGGSVEVHDTLRVGSTVGCSAPRNLFELVSAQHHLLIAGGIGVTPLLAMAETLARRGASWTMIYGGRTRASMAFIDRLSEYEDRVTVVPQNEDGNPDLPAVLAAAQPGTAVYCCGPDGLLEAARSACAEILGEDAFHSERFGASETPTSRQSAEATGEFEVELRRSGAILQIPSDRSVLDMVREVDPDVAYSCEDGFCGSCETKVLEGVPLHRDSVLTKSERDSGSSMMICVSRSRTPRLVLDA